MPGMTSLIYEKLFNFKVPFEFQDVVINLVRSLDVHNKDSPLVRIAFRLLKTHHGSHFPVNEIQDLTPETICLDSTLLEAVIYSYISKYLTNKYKNVINKTILNKSSRELVDDFYEYVVTDQKSHLTRKDCDDISKRNLVEWSNLMIKYSTDDIDLINCITIPSLLLTKLPEMTSNKLINELYELYPDIVIPSKENLKQEFCKWTLSDIYNMNRTKIISSTPNDGFGTYDNNQYMTNPIKFKEWIIDNFDPIQNNLLSYFKEAIDKTGITGDVFLADKTIFNTYFSNNDELSSPELKCRISVVVHTLYSKLNNN